MKKILLLPLSVSGIPSRYGQPGCNVMPIQTIGHSNELNSENEIKKYQPFIKLPSFGQKSAVPVEYGWP